ncbi:MAG: tetratricopeptide repeat protein, partial [Chthoniobacterales bacterium]
NKKLLPVAELDRGFVRPDYPNQVIVSYFQAGRICDYIQTRWGADKLLDMVHSFAQIRTTPDVIQQNLGMSAEEFDKQFMDWLTKDIGKVVDNFDQWRATLKELVQLDKDKDWDGVIKKGEEVRSLYPQYVYDANAYEFIAEADLAKNDKKAAAAILTDYEKMGGRNPGALKQLASLEKDLNQPKESAATLDRINYIYPMGEDLHRQLGELWYAQNNYKGAIREYTAVVALKPLDKASAQFDLAQAYFADGQRDKAEANVLAALEAAPDFRPAQKLLLQLEDSQKATTPER